MSPRVRTTLTSLVLASIAASALTSCAARSLSSEAESLADELRALPGVTQVTLVYTEPVPLDSGKLQLDVAMDPATPAAEIVEVVTTTYAAFSTTHDEEEGDLDIALGDYTVHLRSFKSAAQEDELADAANSAVAVLTDDIPDERGRAVRIDLMTQEIEAAPHVETDVTVTVNKPGQAAVLAELAALQKGHPSLDNAGWRVASGGQPSVSGAAVWELGNTQTFPTPTARALFAELGADLPRRATLALVDDFAHVSLPAAAASAAVDLSMRHITRLGGHDAAYYDLAVNDTVVLSTMSGECWFDSGTVGQELARAHSPQCTKVIPN